MECAHCNKVLVFRHENSIKLRSIVPNIAVAGCEHPDVRDVSGLVSKCNDLVGERWRQLSVNQELHNQVGRIIG